MYAGKHVYGCICVPVSCIYLWTHGSCMLPVCLMRKTKPIETDQHTPTHAYLHYVCTYLGLSL